MTIKQTIKVLPIILLLLSCESEQCYNCTTTVTTYSHSSVISGENKSTFCGTEDEKNDYIRAGNSVAESTSGGEYVMVKTKTTCQ